jgi:hypothetical protein
MFYHINKSAYVFGEHNKHIITNVMQKGIIRSMQKRNAIICFLLLSLFVFRASSAETLLKNLYFSEICGVNFTEDTQMGKIKGRLSVCHLMSDVSPDTKLYFLISHGEEYPSSVDKIIEHSHSPEILKKNEKIDILYTSGANTTCVTTYSLKSGNPEFVSTKTIAWNDDGVFKKSEDFSEYSELWKSRQ